MTIMFVREINIHGKTTQLVSDHSAGSLEQLRTQSPTTAATVAVGVDACAVAVGQGPIQHKKSKTAAAASATKKVENSTATIDKHRSRDQRQRSPNQQTSEETRREMSCKLARHSTVSLFSRATPPKPSPRPARTEACQSYVNDLSLQALQHDVLDLSAELGQRQPRRPTLPRRSES